ncbi:MAG: hypothetical protein R3C41_16065 [Calditrichia bacterium]|nr:hypothetical protein [Calditrichota bacterium]MCB0268108.1 hypothetical protein [Calditrichota bacterium]MCB0286140.1 hypothetical protein [Calditrichota bacterium]MCB9068919.1 hypothetical protein [Calditrichia bacterium]
MMLEMQNIETKEQIVTAAMQKYFRLFVKDWAERHQLNGIAQDELLTLFQDAFFFTDTLLEDDEAEEYLEDDLMIN